MSWRKRDERRRARSAIEAKRERDSDGVRMHMFFRILAGPLALVVWLFLSGTQVSGPVMIAFGALPLVIVVALLKAIWPNRRRPRKPATERSAAEPTIWDRIA